MEQAYEGIAAILFEAGVLDDVLLGGPLRFLVVEFAVRAQWLAGTLSRELREVFPGYWGRPGPWLLFNSQFQAVFGPQLAEWRARLLEQEANQSPAAVPQAQRFKPLDVAYQVVEFNGKEYNLTEYESTIFRVLHQAQKEHRGSVGIKELRGALKISSGKMSDWFRRPHTKELKKLIIHTGAQHYRLDL